MNENSNAEDVQDVDMVAEVGTQYAAFAKSANARSIPDVRDGMKPVHRRIIEIALDMAPPGGSRKKSAAVVGAVLGRRHPHGDSSVYDAMCRLTRNWEIPLPLIEPQGNFGAIDGSGAAATRYTEVRFSSEAKWLLTEGLYEDAVPFKPNYSEEEMEPELLPVRVPMVLINGVPPGSIGVGYASIVPTHNPAEVCRAAALLIQHWMETGEMPTIAQLMSVMPGPDFRTGGILSGPAEIAALYETGGAGLRVRANATIEGDRIVFDGIPPGVTTSDLVESIAEAKRGKEIKGKRADPTVSEIREVRDETSKAKGSSQISVRIIVELRQGEDAAVVLEKLYKYTYAEVSYPCNMTLLDPDGKERQMGLVEILNHWVSFRESCVRRVANFRLRKASDRQHAIQGLQKAMASIDTVIALIRGSPNDEQTRAQLEGVLGVTSRQSETIISMPLRQLNALHVDKLGEEAKRLEADVGHQMQLLTDRSSIFAAIIKELEEAAERLSRIDRRTTITAFGRAGDDARAFVAPERCLLMLSDKGYLRRQPAGSLRAQSRGTRGNRKSSGVKEGEALMVAASAHTHDRLYLFTDTGYSVRCDVHEIPSGGLSHSSGIGLEEGEAVAGFLPVTYPLPQSGSIVLADSAGQVKRFPITEVDSNFRRLRAYQAEEGHRLIGCALSAGGADVFFASRSGLGTRFSEEDVRLTKRESGGVRGMDLDLESGDTSISTGLITDDSQWILCVVSSGMGKRVPVTQFPTQQRGGKGRILIKLREGEELVTALIVRETDDIVVFSESGLANRLHVADVLAYGRETMGKKLMELPDGDRVVSAAIVPEGEN